jgi:uncharacterized protein YunC (DUF1805 family)
MVEISLIETKKGVALGVKINLDKAPLLFIKAPKGSIACAYLSLDTAERLGDALGIVRGVKSFEDVLASKLVGVSSEAKKFGLEVGQTGKEALERLF